MSINKSTTKMQTAARVLLGLFLVTTGTGHLTWGQGRFYCTGARVAAS